MTEQSRAAFEAWWVEKAPVETSDCVWEAWQAGRESMRQEAVKKLQSLADSLDGFNQPNIFEAISLLKEIP